MKELCRKMLIQNNIKPISINKLNAGAASVIYIAQDSKRKYVVKIKLKDGKGLENEYSVLKLIEKQGISSKVYARGELDGRPYLIEEYVSGRRLPWRNIKDKDVILMADFFKRLHLIKLKDKSILSTGKYLPMERLEYPKSFVHLNKKFSELVRLTEDKIKPVKIKKDFVLRHTDPNPHNFIVHNNKIIAIDWEESKIGHFAIDIADFFIKANLTEKQKELFYKSYHLKNIKNSVEPFILTGLLGLICWNIERIELIKKGKLDKQLYKSKNYEKQSMNRKIAKLKKILTTTY